MIRITKSPITPSILTTDGVPDKLRLCIQYDSNPPVYQIPYSKKYNPFKLEIDSSIYGDETVKKQLITDQHEKCCFCEATFLANGYGDVEHYRPKGGYKQTNGDQLGKPGYYWLAYDWDNLLFSCDVCNRSHKKNFFPLSTNYRALSHHDFLEDPINCLLINPNEEDPETHIKFRKEIPIGLTPRGIESIDKYGLARSALNDDRRCHLRDVKANLFISEINIQNLSQSEKDRVKSLTGATSDVELQEIIDVAVDYRNNCAKNNYPFANMIRSNFPLLPQN